MVGSYSSKTVVVNSAIQIQPKPGLTINTNLMKLLPSLVSFPICGLACVDFAGCDAFTHSNVTDASGPAGSCWLFKNSSGAASSMNNKRNSGYIVQASGGCVMQVGAQQWGQSSGVQGPGKHLLAAIGCLGLNCFHILVH